jgi:ABC-2 type transport system permease protein
MSTVATVTPAAGRLRVTASRVIHSEWIKLRSVRSTVITIGAAAFVLVFFGVVFSSAAGSEAAQGPTAGLTGPVDVSLAGSRLAVLIVGVVGALFAASEYSSGLIRTTFAATGSRLAVLRAKAVVIAPTIFVVTFLASIVAFVAGQAVYAGDEPTVALTDPGALRVLVGAAFYHAGIAVLGVALGFILRSTAGAIGTIVATVFIAPGLISFLPESLSDSVLKVLPSEAGASMMAIEPAAGKLGATAAFGVFTVWVIAAIAVAAVRLQQRDA